MTDHHEREIIKSSEWCDELLYDDDDDAMKVQNRTLSTADDSFFCLSQSRKPITTTHSTAAPACQSITTLEACCHEYQRLCSRYHIFPQKSKLWNHSFMVTHSWETVLSCVCTAVLYSECTGVQCSVSVRTSQWSLSSDQYQHHVPC